MILRTLFSRFHTEQGQILGRVMVVLQRERLPRDGKHGRGQRFTGPAPMDTFTCVLPTLVSQGGKPLLCPRTSPRQLRTDLLTHPQPWTQPLPSRASLHQGAPQMGTKTNSLTSTLPRGAPQTQLCQRLSDICGCFAACLFTTQTGQQQQGFFASGDFK